MSTKTEDTKPGTPTATPAAATPTATSTTSTASPATPVPTATTPAPTYATTPWAATASATTHATTIPYQHYQAYSSHYPQAAYGHYQYATPLTAQAMQAQLSRPAASTPVANTATTATAATAGNPSNVDTADIATLNDALGSAGVDLRAEEESLQRSHDHQPYRPYEDRTRKQPFKPSFDTIHLGSKMRTIGTSHKVTRVPEDAVNYLALALRARLQDLLTNMITASHHRNDTQFDRSASLYNDDIPMWRIVVRSDVAKQLAVLERVEREEEIKVRRERKERAELTAAHAAALAAQANGAAAASGASADAGGVAGGGTEEEGGAKKKRKKEGPGVTARNMSEDVRKKMSNAVATQAAGLGGKYAWMNAANANTPAPKPKPAPAAAATSTTTTTLGSTITNANIAGTSTAAITASNAISAAAASSWARPYVPTKRTSLNTAGQASAEEDTRTAVTMRDAMFVIEKERGHGGGRGAARGFI